jgi:hypothetical protein
MNMTNPGRGLVRRLGLAAAAILVLSAASQQSAEALSLASPGMVPVAKSAADGLKTEVRGGHGGGGGGHGGGAAFHGGGFRSGGVAFHGGGYRYGGFRGHHFGGYGYGHHFHRHFYAPSYYYYPHRYCRVVWTYYGPHRICPWRHHRWHHYRYW